MEGLRIALVVEVLKSPYDVRDSGVSGVSSDALLAWNNTRTRCE